MARFGPGLISLWLTAVAVLAFIGVSAVKVHAQTPPGGSCPAGPEPDIDDLRAKADMAQRLYNNAHQAAERARSGASDAEAGIGAESYDAKEARSEADSDHREYTRVYNGLNAARDADRPQSEIQSLQQAAVTAGERYRASNAKATQLETKLQSRKDNAARARDAAKRESDDEAQAKAALQAADDAISSAVSCEQRKREAACPAGSDGDIFNKQQKVDAAQRAYDFARKMAQSAKAAADAADAPIAGADKDAKAARAQAEADHAKYLDVYDRLNAARDANRPYSQIKPLEEQAVATGEHYRDDDKKASDLEAKTESLRRQAAIARDYANTEADDEARAKAALQAANDALSAATSCKKPKPDKPAAPKHMPKPAPSHSPPGAKPGGNKACGNTGGLAGAMNNVACQENNVSP